MPTSPFDQGWWLIQSTVSSPSGPSSVSQCHTPSDLYRPRVSWTTTA